MGEEKDAGNEAGQNARGKDKENARVDLHVHTNECDGAEKEETVTAALDHELAAIAVTDHHTTDAKEKLENIVERRSVPLIIIPGVELSTLEGFDILGLMIDYRNEHLQAEMKRIIIGRQKRGMETAQKLHNFFNDPDHNLGISVGYNDVITKFASNGNIAGGHFEKHIYEQFKKLAGEDTREYVRRMRKFVEIINKANPSDSANPGANLVFDETMDVNSSTCVAFIKEILIRKYLLKRGMPCHAKRTPENCFYLEEAAALIDEAKGVKVVAHPGGTDNDGALPGIIERGKIDGLEVISSKHSLEQCRKYAQMAREKGLVATGGSDWHGNEFTPHLKIGETHYTNKKSDVIWPTYRMVQAIMDRKEQKFGPDSF
jgi:predicted metal-dependent phosphoesterase TrpH